MKPQDTRAYNREAWDAQVRAGNPWTIPVSQSEIDEARQGRVRLLLTPSRVVPESWFPPLRGLKVLGLASGGGQQGPLLAAAGARVTVLDNSPAQLEQDRAVADRWELELTLVEGDMANLECFPDQSFELIFHPCSNCFVPDVLPVWREAYRVLAPGGRLLAGAVNPVVFTLDLALERQGVVQMKYPIPYSDLNYPDDPEIQAMRAHQQPLSFGHTLEDLIGGQLRAGFQLVDFYEDGWPQDTSPIHKFLKGYFATRAVKP